MSTKTIVANLAKEVLPGGQSVKNWKNEVTVYNHRDEKRAFVLLTLAENRRDFKNDKDLDPIFHEVKVFGYNAVHIAETGIPKGTQMIAVVRDVPAAEKTTILTEDKDGKEKVYERTDIELHAINVGPSYSFATIEVEKAEKAEPRSRGRSRDEDEGEDEAPRKRASRSRAAAEDDEEDKPAPRRRAAAKAEPAEEPEEDAAEDEVEDKPAPRRRAAAKAEPAEEEDAEDEVEDKPAPRRRARF